MRMYFLRRNAMRYYFQAGLYTKNEMAWLTKQKKELALKHHPDRGWWQNSFIAMMKEYETIKQAVETVWHFEQRQPKRNKNWNLCFYSGGETIEEAIQFQKEHLKKMRQEERSKRYSMGWMMDYALNILSIPKVQTVILMVSFPFIFRLGLPYWIEGILALFSIHTAIACLLWKRTFAFVSLAVFSLIIKGYEPFIPFGVWDTVWNTVNFWLAVIIIFSIANVKPRKGAMDWGDLYGRVNKVV